jgi:hypothetical protein
LRLGYTSQWANPVYSGEALIMFEIVKLNPVSIVASQRLLLLVLVACLRAPAQNRSPGPVIGVIDTISYEGEQYYVSGWACQQGIRGSIDVHLYAGHAAGDNPPGAFVTGGTADLANEPAVDRECHDANGGRHRFRIAVPNQLLRSFHQEKLYIHGIALAGNVENAAIGGSGRFSFPEPEWPPDPPTPNFLSGPPVVAFDTQRDSCEQADIPDDAPNLLARSPSSFPAWPNSRSGPVPDSHSLGSLHLLRIISREMAQKPSLLWYFY